MVLHQGAVDMHKLGIISDERMREYDEMCLEKPAVPVQHVSTRKPPSRTRSGAPAYAQG